MWAGGKTRMIKRYTASGLLPESSPLYNTSIDTYIEPFFGRYFIWENTLT